MKVELDRIEGAGPERYKVRVTEDDTGSSVPSGTVIGMVKRTGETSWAFGPGQGDDSTFDTSVSLPLTAANVDELKSAIQSRFGLLDVPADRLLDDTLEAFASHVLTPISTLATSTASIGGLIKALAHQVAMIAAADVREDKRDEFFAMFNERVRDETDSLVRRRDQQVSLRVALASILKARGSEVVTSAEGGNDDGPVKH
jgi:hypothetical protein